MCVRAIGGLVRRQLTATHRGMLSQRRLRNADESLDSSNSTRKGGAMYSILYVIGAIVVIFVVLRALGLA